MNSRMVGHPSICLGRRHAIPGIPRTIPTDPVSSGSVAAVAGGLAAMAIGTDTGGSIRSPSFLWRNGGAEADVRPGQPIRRDPVLDGACDHVGPITRTVEDCVIVLQAIAGHDPHDPGSARHELPDLAATLQAGIKGCASVSCGISGKKMHRPTRRCVVRSMLPSICRARSWRHRRGGAPAFAAPLLCRADRADRVRTVRAAPAFAATKRQRVWRTFPVAHIGGDPVHSSADYITAQRERREASSKICSRSMRDSMRC